MVHVVVIAHSELAIGFRDCIEQIFSKQIEYLHVIGVKYSDDVGDMLIKAQSLINSLGLISDESPALTRADILQDNLPEVLLLTDIFGATPHNLASNLVIKNKVELISGLNLPMLIRAVSYAKSGLSICVEKTLDGGVSGVVHINEHDRVQ